MSGRRRPRVLFILGTERPSAIGPGWLTDELLAIAGGTNAAAEAGLSGWANINLETVLKLQPDVLICQVSGGERQIAAAERYWRRLTGLKAVKTDRLYVTGDRRLTIPGSRVAETARKLAEMIHPAAFAPAVEGAQP